MLSDVGFFHNFADVFLRRGLIRTCKILLEKHYSSLKQTFAFSFLNVFMFSFFRHDVLKGQFRIDQARSNAWP